jgi:hypothetical protein
MQNKMPEIPWSAIPLACLYFTLGVQSFVTPCIYQADKCGTTLATLYGMGALELDANPYAI